MQRRDTLGATGCGQRGSCFLAPKAGVLIWRRSALVCRSFLQVCLDPLAPPQQQQLEDMPSVEEVCEWPAV